MEPSESDQHTKMFNAICANPHCRAKKDLKVARYFVCAYYSLPVDSHIIKRVCQPCYESAEKHQNHLVELLKSKKSIYTDGLKKPKNQMVTIDDEEVVEELVKPVEAIEVEDDIDIFVHSLMTKYQFQDQLGASIKQLGKLSIYKCFVNH
jgi:hypothetical protein